MGISSRFKLLATLKQGSFSSSRYLDEVKTTDARIIISRLRLDMHPLNTCHARTNKTDPVGQTCPCGTENETVEHFLLRCSSFSKVRFEFEKRISEMAQGYSRANNEEKLLLLLNVEPRVEHGREKEARELISSYIKTVYTARRSPVG